VGVAESGPRGGTPGRRSGVVVLAGGTGGAKLARGMLEVVGAERLTVIANTGDDIEIYGACVSPDPDLVTFWLADLIDERGWGLAGDTFGVMDGLRELGVEVWFNLGDRDLAWCMERTQMQRDGMRPTEALADLCARLGVKARVLPMCDTPLRTFVDGVGLQEFMIRNRAQGPIEEVSFQMPQQPSTSPEVRAALAGAEAVIVGPSNPVISIWPILMALRQELAATAAPIICVSPVVAGEIVKGPTAACLQAYGHPTSAAGVAAFYEQVAPGLLDGILCDEPLAGDLPCMRAQMLMDGALGRTRLAQNALTFAQSLAAG
jgi:LPPG:FO 2-phospho-L-lactate transferase